MTINFLIGAVVFWLLAAVAFRSCLRAARGIKARRPGIPEWDRQHHELEMTEHHWHINCLERELGIEPTEANPTPPAPRYRAPVPLAVAYPPRPAPFERPVDMHVDYGAGTQPWTPELEAGHAPLTVDPAAQRMAIYEARARYPKMAYSESELRERVQALTAGIIESFGRRP